MKNHLTTTGLRTGGIHAISITLQFLIAAILARKLEPAGYGLYSFALAIAALATVPSQFGLANVALRFSAFYDAKNNFALLRGLKNRVMQWGFSYGALAGIILITSSYLAKITIYDSPVIFSLAWSSLVVITASPLHALTGLLRGLRFTTLSQIPEYLIRPIFFILLIISAPLTPFYITINPHTTLILHAFSLSLACFTAWFFVRKYFPPPIFNVQPIYENKSWILSAAPLSLMGATLITNNQADTIMLGWLATPGEVGTYRVASQLASTVSIPLIIINIIIAPHITRLHTLDKNIINLQRLLTSSIRIAFLCSTPIVICYIIFGSRLLAAIFGQPYSTAETVLLLLTLGQTINVFSGSVGLILNMTGNESLAAKGVLIAAITNIILNLALIPLYGAKGAAIATTASTILWNIYLVNAVYCRTGLYSTIIGNMRKFSSHEKA